MVEPYNVRFLFTKVGSLQFISHLDLQRTMKSALIRANAPLWYTEGFNPHPKMVFGIPLSIGVESTCELLDVKLNDNIDLGELKDALNAQTTSEMSILKCYIPREKLSEIAFAKYTMEFDGDITEARNLFTRPCIVMKRTKSGERETDISPMVNEIVFNGRRINTVLQSNSEVFLNPDYVSREISKATGRCLLSTTRIAVLKSDMSEFK